MMLGRRRILYLTLVVFGACTVGLNLWFFSTRTSGKTPGVGGELYVKEEISLHYATKNHPGESNKRNVNRLIYDNKVENSSFSNSYWLVEGSLSEPMNSDEALDLIKSRLENCENKLGLGYISPNPEAGLGLILNEILLLTNRALAFGLTPVFDPKSLVWFRNTVVENLLYFPCVAEVDPEQKLKGETDTAKRKRIITLECEVDCEAKLIRTAEWMPDEFAHHGLKWWYKQIAKVVIKPNTKLLVTMYKSRVMTNFPLRSTTFPKVSPQLSDKFSSPFSTLFDFGTKNIERPLIALHLRRGDSCVNNRPVCLNNASQAFEFMAANGLKNGTIILATDSSALGDDVNRVARHFGFKDVYSFSTDRTFYSKLEKEKYVPIEDQKQLKEKIESTDLVLESLLDLVLLAEGDIHVGSFYSNFIRFAMTLSGSNQNSRYVSFDARWCPYDTCSLGYLRHGTCKRWFKHLCQWKPAHMCPGVKHCSHVGARSCSQDCAVYHMSIASYNDVSRSPNKPPSNIIPGISNIFKNMNLCCKKECIEKMFSGGNIHDQCEIIKTTMLSVDRLLEEKVYNPHAPIPFLEEEAPKCEIENIVYSKESIQSAIERGVRTVLLNPEPVDLDNAIPEEKCRRARKVPDYKQILFRNSSSVIVYMAQKKHSSYGHNSMWKLEKSLNLLYENYNSVHHTDILIFHSGDFNAQDLEYLRNGKEGPRPEIQLVELGSKYWELPGFLIHSSPEDWEDDQFSTGYRHMCRWYAGLLFEFVDKLGYEYVMRMDEDSYLLSPINYDIFEFMKSNNLEYGFRIDAFEPCCDVSFRNAYLSSFMKHMHFNPEFIQDCCLDDHGKYNNYGYYNNFFVSKVSFWRQAKVRKFFNFVDWTGGFYLYRENDLALQSLSVQLFMPKEKVYKFTDWSYEHVTGDLNCEWGGVVKGTLDFGSATAERLQEYSEKSRNKKLIKVFNDRTNQLEAIYCHNLNYWAAVMVNFHGSNSKRIFSSVFSHPTTIRKPAPATSSLLGKSPFCFDSTDRSVIEMLLNGPVDFTKAKNILRNNMDVSAKRYNNLAKDASRLQKLLAKMSSECVSNRHKQRSLYVEEPECGAGCTINFMVKPIFYALKHDQRLMTPGTRWKRRGKDLNCTDMSCFLRVYSNKKICGGVPTGSRKRSDGLWRKVSQDDVEFFESLSPRSNLQSLVVDKEFANYGLFWNVAQILHFVMQPSENTARVINAIVQENDLLNPDHYPVLGVHIRLGDSCSDPERDKKGRICQGLEAFIPHIEKMIQYFGYKSIYLATDSSTAIRNATRDFPDYKWLYNKRINRDKYKVFEHASVEDELSIEGILFGHPKLRKQFDPYDEMVNFLADTIILGKYTHGLVGKYSSNMDRIVSAISSVHFGNDNGNCLQPVISLDSPWCFDFMVNSGRSYTNQSFYC